ncbi:hypothetical protein [Ruminococcus sp. JL13D9]
MTKKEIARLIEWLKIKGKSDEEIDHCISYITTGKESSDLIEMINEK